MSENKTQLIQIVKEWVRIDNEIRQLQKEISIRRQDKKLMNEQLKENKKKNNIDCFDLNDGKICYTKKNIKKPINNKILLDILTKYYNGDISQASEINNFINNNRIEVTKENLTRKISKNTNK